MQHRDRPYPICRDFIQGKCVRDNCKFRHEDQAKPMEHSGKGRQEGGRQEGGRPLRNKDKYNRNKPRVKPRNTECFIPRTRPVDMRIVFDLGTSKMKTELTDRDVLVVPNLFNTFPEGSIYNSLMHEIDNCGIAENELLKLWHGNDKIEGTHFIANDRTPWKEKCPTFTFVVNKIRDFFAMDIQATRLNLYKDTSQWKPFHHDSAFVNPERAKLQNFTVAVSFGCSRDAAFEHALTKTVVSLPQEDGVVYCFANETNAIWRHGILQDMPVRKEGRISVICWGKVENVKSFNVF